MALGLGVRAEGGWHGRPLSAVPSPLHIGHVCSLVLFCGASVVALPPLPRVWVSLRPLLCLVVMVCFGWMPHGRQGPFFDTSSVRSLPPSSIISLRLEGWVCRQESVNVPVCPERSEPQTRSIRDVAIASSPWTRLGPTCALAQAAASSSAWRPESSAPCLSFPSQQGWQVVEHGTVLLTPVVDCRGLHLMGTC